MSETCDYIIDICQEHSDDAEASGNEDGCPYCVIQSLRAEVSDQKTIKEALRFALHLAYRDAGMPDDERQAKVASVIHGAEAVSGSPKPQEDWGTVTMVSKCSYWPMRLKGRSEYPYSEHWRDCIVCQKLDPDQKNRSVIEPIVRQMNPVDGAE